MKKKGWNLTNIIEFQGKLMIIVQIKFVFFFIPHASRLNPPQSWYMYDVVDNTARQNAKFSGVLRKQQKKCKYNVCSYEEKKMLKQNTFICVIWFTYMCTLHVRKWISVFAYMMNTWMLDFYGLFCVNNNCCIVLSWVVKFDNLTIIDLEYRLMNRFYSVIRLFPILIGFISGLFHRKHKRN